MSQPNGSTITTAPTQTEAALEEFRKAGVVEKARRPYLSKRMQGFNAEVYAAWIERWANNAASNYAIARRCEGVAFLRNAAKDVPAIVVGIGPSFDQEVMNLKSAPRHAIIIATDAAVRPLLRHGIKPDIVVNYDAKDEQCSMWNNIDTSDLVLLASTVTSPKTIEAWKGGLMFFNMMQSDDEFATNILPCLYPYTGQLPNMGTVGNGAVFLAYQMGCKPILGVGMDLCYQVVVKDPASANVPPKDSLPTAGWKYRCTDWEYLAPAGDHTEGRWDEVVNKVLYDNDARLAHTQDEVIKGKTYKTDDCLQHYRNSLLSGIGQFDIPFINCSGGVLESLTKSMTLTAALQEKCYPSLDPGRTVAKHLLKIIPDGKANWTLFDNDRIFIPTNQAALQAPNPKR